MGRHVLTVALLTILLVPAAQAQVTLPVEAPVPLCGTTRIQGDLQLYHYEAAASGLELRLLEPARVRVREEVRMPGHYLALASDREWPAGTQVTLRVGSFLTGRLSQTSLSAGSGPDCEPFMLGPNPLRLHGRPGPREINPWHVFAAMPEEAHVIVAPAQASLRAGILLLLEEGEAFARLPDGETRQERGGLHEGSYDPRLTRAGNRLAAESQPRRVVEIESGHAEVRIRNEWHERPARFWSGDAKVDDHWDLLPGKYFPRPLTPSFADLVQRWSSASTTLAAEHLVLQSLDEVLVTSTEGGELRIRPGTYVRTAGTAPDQRSLRLELSQRPTLPAFATANVRTPAPAAEIAIMFVLLASAAMVGVLVHHRRTLASLVWVPLLGRQPRPPNARQQKILEILQQRPGMGVRELHRHLGGGWGTTLYHVYVMEKKGLVRSIQMGRVRRLFLTQQATGKVLMRSAVAADPVLGRLIQYVEEHPACSQSELAQNLNLTASTVHWHVKRLERLGLVRRERAGRHVRHYTANEEPPMGDPLVRGRDASSP